MIIWLSLVLIILVWKPRFWERVVFKCPPKTRTIQVRQPRHGNHAKTSRAAQKLLYRKPGLAVPSLSGAP